MLPNVTVSKNNRFLLVYGSETGQSQAIAEEIAEKSVDFGLKAALHCLDETGKKFNIEEEKCVVIVTSTTGDGDPPANASKFMRRIKKRTLSDTYLSHLHYALLGLGDTNYSNFCRCPRDMDKRLEQLGAKRFYPTGLADDGVGLEVVAEPWLEGLYPALQKFLSVSVDDVSPNSESPRSFPLSTSTNDARNTPSPTERLQALSTNDSKVLNDAVKGEVAKANQTPLMNGIRSRQNHSSPSDSDNNSDRNNSNIDNDVSDSKLALNSSVAKVSECVGDVPSRDYVCVRVDAKDFICDKDFGLHQPSSNLEGKPLTVPALPPPFLRIKFSDDTVEMSSLSYQNNCKLPSAASEIFYVPVSSAQVLTHPDALKKTLLLTLNHKGQEVDYSPGDAISVVCPNNPSEINFLLNRLNISKYVDCKMTLDLIPDTQKRRAAVPAHIHPETTLKYVFTHCVSIRDVPSKAFLRAMVECTDEVEEVRRLQELCSKDGAAEYTQWIREKHISLLDFLYAFPSCQPSIERVLEFLPRLQPRPYSICSSASHSSETFDVVFNVVDLPATISEGHLYHRRGVCTGWLDDITGSIQNCQDSELNQNLKVPIFLRTNQHFRPPSDLSKPVIMVGPGTGVAPFIGFLQHRAHLKQNLPESASYGETWLFFGCRDKNKDFLFQQELETFLSVSILSRLCVAVSRAESECGHRYVQDFIQAESKSIARLVSDDDALVYICGDAQHMARDVGTAFENVLVKEKGLSSDDAHLAIMKKRLQKSYLEDVWT